MPQSDSPHDKPRFPRDKFSRALTTLCTRLDAASTVEFDYQSPRRRWILLPVTGRGRATLHGLWAFGSWARGAPTCQDLDLLAEISFEWVGSPTRKGEVVATAPAPVFHELKPVLLGRQPLVHVLDIKDVRNGNLKLGAAEVVPIWQPGGDWRAAIAGIKEDPQAGRKGRYHDALPVSIERLTMSLPEAEYAVRAWEKGLIAWEFVTIDDATARPPDDLFRKPEFYKIEREVHNLARSYTAYRASSALRERVGFDNIEYRFADRSVEAGMFCGLAAEAVVITLTNTKRGPNGSLIVTRGPAFTPEAALELQKKLKASTPAAEA